MKKEEKPKPCPFCGGEARIVAYAEYYTYVRAGAFVLCSTCDIKIIATATKQQYEDFCAKHGIAMWYRTPIGFRGLTTKGRHIITKELRRQAIEKWNIRSK